MMHQSEWERLTTDEKLDHLRLHQIAQDALIATVMQALEQRLGITFTMGGDSEPEDPA